MSETRSKMASGFIWRFLERFGAQGVTFVVSIILARLIDPEVYGSLALVTVLTSILQVFVDSGLGNALIQKKDADEVDFSSVFFFNLAVCSTLYVLLFLFAPLIAQFYNNPELTPVIRVLGLTIVISGLKNVQQAYVTRNLLFKKFFFATLGGTIGAGVIGIWMAYHGYGIWALVAQYIFNHAVDTAILWITVKWRPVKSFSTNRLQGLIRYGWKLLAASLFDTLYNNLRTLVIGKKYSEEDLAFFNRGHYLPSLLASNVSSSIDSVLFPSLSKIQDNTAELKKLTKRSIRVSSYVMFPFMMGLAVCGEQIIKVLLSEKWLPALPYLRIYCFYYAFYTMDTTNLNAIKATGRSDIYLKIEVAKKVIGFCVIAITMWISIDAIAYSLVFMAIIGLYLNAFPNKRLIDYGFIDQIKDILPNTFLTIGMGICVIGVKSFTSATSIGLLLQVASGCIAYVLLSIVSKNESYYFVAISIKNFMSKIKTRKRN